MFLAAVIIFWAGVAILFYTYIGYPLFLVLVTRKKKINCKSIHYDINATRQPSVTIVVAAYNEARILSQKIANCLAIDYCQKDIHLLFVTDGSDDGSNEIISKYPSIQLLHIPERRGKIAAINRAMLYVKTEIVVFTDANAMLNTESIYNIVRHFTDPKVGGVAGEKKVVDDSSSGNGEGAYWRYESAIKQMDSDLYSVVGAAGELFAMRSSLFVPLNEDIILDDFVQSLIITQKGYVVKYEPEAYAVEHASLSLADEQERKIRISAGGFQAIGILKPLLNVFRYKTLSFQYISHRVLRWTLCPLSLPAVFLSSIYIYTYTNSTLYYWAVILQILFYLAALVGYLSKWKLFYISFYFVFINLCIYAGFFRFINRKQSAIWKKVHRQNE